MQQAGPDLAIVNPKCKKCHGTGIYCVIRKKDGPEKIWCDCVIKNTMTFVKLANEMKTKGETFDPVELRDKIARGEIR